jgi:aspartate carbamoyltransferase catalytic subunit
MNHFLDISQLSKIEAESLIESALILKDCVNYPSYPEYPVANLFYENSTRTRVSFEMAANHLNMPVINLDLNRSSELKGETIDDTIATLSAMGISTFIVRHSIEGLPIKLAANVQEGKHIINAGDGRHAHPSQALLDMVTIKEKKPDLAQLKIAVLGDVLHSRVANSFQQLCKLLEVGQLTMIAPDIWQPRPDKVIYGHVTNSLKEGLADADVIMCLRVQNERLKDSEQFDINTYRKEYALTQTTLKLAKPDAIVMHPGPINRGVEIDDDVADGQQSTILQQVQNGVYTRMAILQAVIE